MQLFLDATFLTIRLATDFSCCAAFISHVLLGVVSSEFYRRCGSEALRVLFLVPIWFTSPCCQKNLRAPDHYYPGNSRVMAHDEEKRKIDLLSYIFGKGNNNPEKPVSRSAVWKTASAQSGGQILVDAEDPSRFLTTSSARSLVRRLIAGLKTEGLQEGDCVCVKSFNDVSYR